MKKVELSQYVLQVFRNCRFYCLLYNTRSKETFFCFCFLIYFVCLQKSIPSNAIIGIKEKYCKVQFFILPDLSAFKSSKICFLVFIFAS